MLAATFLALLRILSSMDRVRFMATGYVGTYPASSHLGRSTPEEVADINGLP
jgi:hypothetical protein